MQLKLKLNFFYTMVGSNEEITKVCENELNKGISPFIFTIPLFQKFSQKAKVTSENGWIPTETMVFCQVFL